MAKINLKILAPLAFGLMFGFLTTEIAFRILPNSITKIDFEIKDDNRIFDPLRFYKYKPNSERVWTALGSPTIWHLNNYGFRERPIQEKGLTGNSYRIMVVGDSITMGLGFEDYEAYPRQMEKMLNPKEFKPGQTIFEVLNFGLWAQGPMQYRTIVNDYLKSIKPDLVIVGLFSGNDPFDDAYYERAEKFRILKSLPDFIIPFRLNEFLKKNSYTYQFFLTKYYHLVQKTDPSDITSNDETIAKGWELNKKAILEIKRQTDKNNVKFVVLGLPSGVEIVKGDPKLYIERKKQLESFLKESKINYFDLYQDFLNNPNKKKLFIEGDTHYTPFGSEYAAEKISEYLIKNKIVPNEQTP